MLELSRPLDSSAVAWTSDVDGPCGCRRQVARPPASVSPASVGRGGPWLVAHAVSQETGRNGPGTQSIYRNPRPTRRVGKQGASWAVSAWNPDRDWEAVLLSRQPAMWRTTATIRYDMLASCTSFCSPHRLFVIGYQRFTEDHRTQRSGGWPSVACQDQVSAVPSAVQIPTPPASAALGRTSTRYMTDSARTQAIARWEKVTGPHHQPRRPW